MPTSTTDAPTDRGEGDQLMLNKTLPNYNTIPLDDRSLDKSKALEIGLGPMSTCSSMLNNTLSNYDKSPSDDIPRTSWDPSRSSHSYAR